MEGTFVHAALSASLLCETMVLPHSVCGVLWPSDVVPFRSRPRSSSGHWTGRDCCICVVLAQYAWSARGNLCRRVGDYAAASFTGSFRFS